MKLSDFYHLGCFLVIDDITSTGKSIVGSKNGAFQISKPLLLVVKYKGSDADSTKQLKSTFIVTMLWLSDSIDSVDQNLQK